MGVMAPGKSTELRRVRIGSTSGIEPAPGVSSSSDETIGITCVLPSSMSDMPAS